MIELQYYLTNLPDCFIYGLLAMGIYISLRILDIPDLTTEGSFGFGAVISVLVSLNGHPALALLAGIVAGALAGFITGCLQTKLSVHPVLAGIITMSALYSINLVCYSLTDKGATTNLSYGKITIFDKIKELLGITGQFNTSMLKAVVSFIIVVLVIAVIIWFFKTHMGLCIRATGDNPDMVRASSINVDRPTLIYGLAAVIIGEAIFGKRGAAIGVISAVTGSVIYKLIVAFVIRQNLFGDKSANLMKLTCALIVAITLAIPAIKEKIAEKRSRKAEM